MRRAHFTCVVHDRNIHEVNLCSRGDPFSGLGVNKTFQPVLQYVSILLPLADTRLELCIIRRIISRADVCVDVAPWGVKKEKKTKQKQEQKRCIQKAGLHINTPFP